MTLDPGRSRTHWRTLAGQTGPTDASAAGRAATGSPRSLLRTALDAALAATPVLGFVSAMLMAAELALTESNAAALLVLVLGFVAMLCGDRLVRPLQWHGGRSLSFHWLLGTCAVGLSVLGLAGVLVGPVLLSLARELCAMNVHDTVE